MASSTGMFNLENLDWDQEALALLGIRKSQLPEIVPTTHILKRNETSLRNINGY